MWTREDIDAAPNGKVTTRQAHGFMSRWREASDMQQTPTMDLFDCAHFEWIGFEIARLGVVDLNTHTARVDFVVHRDDLNVVRLHPSQNREARPVITRADVDGGAVVRHGERVESGRGEHALSFTAGAVQREWKAKEAARTRFTSREHPQPTDFRRLRCGAGWMSVLPCGLI